MLREELIKPLSIRQELYNWKCTCLFLIGQRLPKSFTSIFCFYKLFYPWRMLLFNSHFFTCIHRPLNYEQQDFIPHCFLGSKLDRSFRKICLLRHLYGFRHLYGISRLQQVTVGSCSKYISLFLICNPIIFRDTGR